MMKPRPFQNIGINKLAMARVFALCDDMGLGKSCQAILAADAVGARYILILCPAMPRDRKRHVVT
jgi:SNF2 family DNA or RNA helicase